MKLESFIELTFRATPQSGKCISGRDAIDGDNSVLPILPKMAKVQYFLQMK